MRKAAFFSFLHDVPLKVRGNSVFHVFETLRTKFAKMWINSVFWAFCTISSKKCEKTVFFFYVFRDTLYKVRKICEKKTAFFELFARCPAKSVRNQCFFLRFSRHFVQISQNMRKNSVFLAFYAISCKKCEKTVFFSRFSRHFAQSSQKCEKTVFFWAFWTMSLKKCEKTFF